MFVYMICFSWTCFFISPCLSSPGDRYCGIAQCDFTCTACIAVIFYFCTVLFLTFFLPFVYIFLQLLLLCERLFLSCRCCRCCIPRRGGKNSKQRVEKTVLISLPGGWRVFVFILLCLLCVVVVDVVLLFFFSLYCAGGGRGTMSSDLIPPYAEERSESLTYRISCFGSHAVNINL